MSFNIRFTFVIVFDFPRNKHVTRKVPKQTHEFSERLNAPKVNILAVGAVTLIPKGTFMWFVITWSVIRLAGIDVITTISELR